MHRFALRFLAGAIFLADLTFAQPCLVHGDPQTVGMLETFSGLVQPKFAPVEASASVTIAIFPAMLSAEQRERLNSGLTALYKSVGKTAPLSLSTFDGHQFNSSGPIPTAAAWRNAVREVLAAQGQEGSQPDPVRLYSAIATSANGLGGNWSSVVLAGQLPDLPANLRDYAVAWVSSRFCAQKLRVSYLDPDGKQSDFWNSTAKATGGLPGFDTLAEIPALADGPWAEVAWEPPPLSRGFVLHRGKLHSQSPDSASVEMPVLAVAAGATLPSLEEYAELENLHQQLSELDRVEQPGASQVQQTRVLLERAIAINARDKVALRAAANLYKRGRDYRTAADLIDKLLEVQPRDSALEAESGHCRYLAGDMDGAEKALLLARESKAGGSTTPEDLARIHLARKDDAGALPFLEETLAVVSDRAELWFTRADIASRLGNWEKWADSLEKGLKIDRQNLDRRTSLVQLYLDHAAGDKALPHVRLVTAALPKEAAVRRRYAEFLDQLNQPQEALAAWKKTIESDASLEPAHYRVSRLLFDGGGMADSLAAAEEGLKVAPQSARLYLIKAEVLERQGRYFDARQTLRSASKVVEDVQLLARLAEMEDVSGPAPQAYMNLVLAGEKAGANSPELAQALERGLEVAVRDEDRKSAAFFSQRLSAAGKTNLSSWLAQSAEKPASGATVPGGLEGFAFIAHSHFRSPQAFFTEYCRTLAVSIGTINDKERNLYQAGIHKYFQQVASLKAMGTTKGSTTEVAISIADKKALQRTEKILEILGWKLHTNKGEAKLEAGEKKSQAERQETASALALDEIGMQDALQSGKGFSFQITDEVAPVLLGESVWMTTFFGKTKFDGGFAEALATNLHVAKTYAALSTMSARAVSVLTAGSELKTLAEKHADLLYRYGSAFALRGDHAAVPGGEAAEAVWEKMAGVPPAQASRFFHSLLEKDEGKLLAYFATLGQVDTDHQRFFTRSVSRAARFYALFRDSIELSLGAGKQTHNSSFTEFLREVPIDADLHVLFPGGPGVWMLAKGNSSSLSQASKMVKKLSRITAPEAEDEILDRLARTQSRISMEKISELDHFVAVVRIDAHRPEPLDEASALLLAQHYGADKVVYPYFAVLTGLGQPQFEHFFALAEQLHTVQRTDLNVILGELHSLIELISLAQEAGAFNPKAAAELFDSVCLRFGKATTPAGYTSAALESARELLSRSSPKDAAANPDGALERTLLGQGGPVRFDLDDGPYEFDPHALRRAAYEKVLSEQKVTALKTLFEFYDHVQNLAHARGSAAEHVKALDSLRGGLLTVLPPKGARISPLDHKIVLAFDEGKVAELIARLKERIAKKKVNQKDVEQLCDELTALICPQVKLALSGVVYAYFLSPDDLLVSQDPLFLRKHRFLSFGTSAQPVFTKSDLDTTSEGLGSYLEGGFSDFPATAGRVALSGAQPPSNTENIAAVEMGTLRATDWNRIGEQDLLLFGLRLRMAREWLLHAGADDKLLAGLADDTQGLLSPTRRGELLDALAERDWNTAFKNVTLGDLYALSNKYLERYSGETWRSPVMSALLRLSKVNDGDRLRWLGPSATELAGCSHSHLDVAGPYEEYEKLILPYKLAERAAEFKLYLADFAGRAGIPPAALSAIGQPVTSQIFKHMRMTDLLDWRDAQIAFAGLNENLVRAALPGEK